MAGPVAPQSCMVARHSRTDIDPGRRATPAGPHHTVEDRGIAPGEEAVASSPGDKGGIARRSSARAPLDDSLARVAVDLSGRASHAPNTDHAREKPAASTTCSASPSRESPAAPA